MCLHCGQSQQDPKCLDNTKQRLECPGSFAVRPRSEIFKRWRANRPPRSSSLFHRVRESFASFNRRKTSCIPTFNVSSAPTDFFYSSAFFFLLLLSLSPSPRVCHGHRYPFLLVLEALRFLEWILRFPHLNLPYSSSRYVREHSPRHEYRCALGRISPEEARG